MIDAAAVGVPPNGHQHFFKWTDVKASMHGGPPAPCRFCGETSHDESPVKARFRALCREIIAEGRVPFPTELNRRMGWGGQTNAISGRYVKIRTWELEAAGFVKGDNGKWTHP